MGGLRRLEGRIARATGADSGLDRAIREALDGAAPADGVPPYTASVDACLALIGRALPGWHWHVGWGPGGILPYASLSRDGAGPAGRVEMTAPTVPLALLGTLVKAARLDRGGADAE